jgi:uncharacterized protein YjbJ (UPF0337 family)
MCRGHRERSGQCHQEDKQMETTKLEGTLREAAGSVQETVGSVTGDVGMQLAGTAKELSGKAQRLCADATDLARETMASNPIGTMAGAAVVGFILGAMWSWNRADPDYGDARRR